MGVSFTGRLSSPTATLLIHEPSGATYRTVAPQDNGGDGSTFSPTDLCAASLGACAATTVSLFAKRNGIPLSGITFRVEKIMTAAPPRRIARLVVGYTIETPGTDEQYETLVSVAKTCPVRLSLSPDVEVVETYQRG